MDVALAFRQIKTNVQSETVRGQAVTLRMRLERLFLGTKVELSCFHLIAREFSVKTQLSFFSFNHSWQTV